MFVRQIVATLGKILAKRLARILLYSLKMLLVRLIGLQLRKDSHFWFFGIRRTFAVLAEVAFMDIPNLLRCFGGNGT